MKLIIPRYIDLRSCNKGDYLFGKNKTIFTYKEHNYDINNPFPHIIKCEYYYNIDYEQIFKLNNGVLGSRTHEGYVFLENRNPGDDDVIYILPKSQFNPDIAILIIQSL